MAEKKPQAKAEIVNAVVDSRGFDNITIIVDELTEAAAHQSGQTSAATKPQAYRR